MNTDPQPIHRRVLRIPRRLAGSTYRAILRWWHKHHGVPWRVAGHRFLFVLGSEPHYLRFTDNDAQRKNLQQLDTFSRCLKPGETVVDVGAFIGLYTLLAAKCVGPAGHVFAFEPVPESVEILRRNLSLNDLPSQITVENLALSDQQASLSMQTWGSSSINTLTDAQLGPGASSIQVPTESLDSYCQQHSIRPDWVKIDVEGWELCVLQGMKSLLDGPVAILCEMHPHLWSVDTFSKLRHLLVSHGREIQDLNGVPVDHVEYGPYFIVGRGVSIAPTR